MPGAEIHIREDKRDTGSAGTVTPYGSKGYDRNGGCYELPERDRLALRNLKHIGLK